jgi:hypothetical protein
MRPIYDISFAGTVITIDGATITDFMDDSHPIDIQETDVSTIEWDCNGCMIRTVKPSAIIMSITVIPGSRSDDQLRTIWKKNLCSEGSIDLGYANRSLSCSISSGNPTVGSYTFTGGTCLSGAAGITSNGQGKMGGNTYTFAFSKTT